MLLTSVGVLVGLLTGVVTAQSEFVPARPPSLPLVVKSPYLSIWVPVGLDGGNGGYLAGQWPSFWTGQATGWTGMIRVDNETFVWMGKPLNIENEVTQIAFEYTSTKSAFTMEVDDKILMKITFLSPLTPTDFRRQSLLFSYMLVEVWSMDGHTHTVQLYTDISAGDPASVAQWDFGISDGVAYHQVWKQNQQHFTEVEDRAEWGNFYYATDATNEVTHQSGVDEDVRGAFMEDGKLGNVIDNDFRAIHDRRPVFAYAKDLGNVLGEASTTLFTIGLCQQEAVQFLGRNGLTILPSLWIDYFSNEIDALTFFHKDYDELDRLSSELDITIQRDSVIVAGHDYATLTSLAARQAFGATQLVGTADKPYLFLKEISSNGNTQTIDVIYPAIPIFLYLNPELVRLLLDPHFENQESGHYPNKWPMHDLGTHYPNATGHPDGNDEQMPLEEGGNNIIMILAYYYHSQNLDYLEQHYPILHQWADFLAEESLHPAHQLSTDDFAGQLANQTNLALKGIIALEAMSQIAFLVGETHDAKKYSSIAHNYIKKWDEELAINRADDPPHSSLTYNDMDSYGLLYNLYSDKLLRLNLVPEHIYEMQSRFYPTVEGGYGVPLDTRNTYTKSDWEIFCAAVATSHETRDMFIKSIVRWVNETPSSHPFSDLYEVDGGHQPTGVDFKARPVVGAMFALLALLERERGVEEVERWEVSSI